MADVKKTYEGDGVELLEITFRGKVYSQKPNITTKVIEFEDSIEYELQKDIDTAQFNDLNEEETDEIKYWFDVIEYGDESDIEDALEILNEYEEEYNKWKEK